MPTTLRQFIQDKANTSQDVTVGLIFSVAGTDGELYVLETDPLNPSLPTGITISAAELQFLRNTVATTPALDIATPTNNRPFPSVQLAGDSLGPIAMDAGATGATVQRVVDATCSRVSTAQHNHTTPVTTSAYTQIIASTASVARKVEIWDTSGEILILAFGAAASEVDQIYIPQGGNGPIDLLIPAGTRVSIKSLTAATSSGRFLINTYN